MLKHASAIGLILTGTCAAQWLNHRDPKTPRTADGQPNLSAPVFRLNGKPDLSGVWRAERTPVSEFNRVLGEEFAKIQVDFADVTKHVVNVFWDVKPGEEPVRPEVAAILKQRQTGENFPPSHCLPTSIPASMMILNFKILQAAGETIVFFENGDPPRQIYTDGRSLPSDPEPTWMGYSVGKWEGDTFVVETAGLNSRGWLDAFGHPRSEKMHITERFRRRDFGHMDLEMIFDDPTYYTRPFSFKTAATLVSDSDVLEYICTENEKDRVHLDRAK